MLACTWTSQKWEGRAPDGDVLVRVYAGRFGGRDLTLDSDDELVALRATEVGAPRGHCRAGVDPRPPLAARNAAVRPRPSGATGADRGGARRASRPRGRRRRVPRSRDPGLHPVGRGGRGVGRPSARRSGRVNRARRPSGSSRRRRGLMPGGVSSPVRAFRAVGGSPLFIERGEGAYLVDVDGNRYVDYVLSWGPLILGHAHPRVVAALEEALRKGTSFGAPSPLELELARLIPRSDAEPRARPVRQLRDRGDDERAARRARVHGAVEDRQVRRVLPRPRGSAPRAGGIGRRDARASRLARGHGRARSPTRSPRRTTTSRRSRRSSPGTTTSRR